MKLTKVFSLIGLVVLTMSMSKCQNKNIEQNPPFAVTNAYSQKWMAGVAQGGSGINLIVPVANMQAGVRIDSVYYMGYKVALATKPGDNTTYVAAIVLKAKQDMTMSDEAGAEYGNPVPNVGQNTEFKLAEDEIVIQYQYQGKTTLSKFNGVTQKAQLNYPSAPNPDDEN